MRLNHHEYIRFPFEGRTCALLISRAGDESNDPRSWHNLGTMACFHSRYHLGDLIPERTPEEYDEYRAYQKHKTSVNAALDSLRGEHETMCERVLRAFGETAEYDDDGVVLCITDQQSARKLMSMAHDWF